MQINEVESEKEKAEKETRLKEWNFTIIHRQLQASRVKTADNNCKANLHFQRTRLTSYNKLAWPLLPHHSQHLVSFYRPPFLLSRQYSNLRHYHRLTSPPAHHQTFSAHISSLTADASVHKNSIWKDNS